MHHMFIVVVQTYGQNYTILQSAQYAHYECALALNKENIQNNDDYNNRLFTK